MAEIFIPGVSSRFDTGKTVERLVELEGRRLKKLEKERDALLLEQKVWGKLNAELLVLKQAAMKLYGVRTPFKELAAVFESDRYFLAEVLPGANLGKKSVEVLELASVSRVTSDPLGRDASIPAGRFVITTGGRDIPVDWPGGPPAALVTLINSVGKDAVRASLIKKGEDGFLLVLESAKTGGENALRFTDTDGVLEKIGVLGRAVTQSFRDDFDVNRTTPLPGTPAGSVSLSQGQLVLEPGASVELPLPHAVAVREGTTLTVRASAEEIRREAPPLPAGPSLSSLGSVMVENIEIKGDGNISLYALPQPEAPEVAPIDPRILGVRGADGAVTMIPVEGLSAEGATFTLPLAAPPADVTAVLFTNPSEGHRVRIDGVSVAETSAGGAGAKNVVSPGENSRIKIDGIEIERPGNVIDDAIPGVTLRLNAVTPGPVTLDVTRDIEKAWKAVLDFVEQYNKVIGYMNLVGTRAGTGENETDPERGLITGDTMLMRIRNKMSTLVVNAYPTSEAPAISTLGHIGISTGVHGSLWENISSGLLTVEEEKFTDAFVHHPEAVAELFGNDTDNDYLTDSGVAFAMDRVLKEVTTRARGLIALRQDTTDTQLKQNGRQIDDWKQHLEEYEKKLRRDFTTMEGRVNEMEHTQDWIQQQTERKGQ